MWNRVFRPPTGDLDRPPGPTAARPPTHLPAACWPPLWLLDAVLQIQPFMFTRGSNGFSGMLNGAAGGNPGWVAHTITWNGSIVYHHPIATNTVFALIQFLIAFGIVSKRTCKPALVLSIVWSVGVWWFGEGLGGVFAGAATPLGGGPGGVLFYALLAVLLWPKEGSDAPFVAARSVGVPAAKAIWAAVWVLLGLLSVVGAGRSPQALHDLVSGLNNGQPGWLAHIDRVSESFLLHHGTHGRHPAGRRLCGGGHRGVPASAGHPVSPWFWPSPCSPSSGSPSRTWAGSWPAEPPTRTPDRWSSCSH